MKYKSPARTKVTEIAEAIKVMCLKCGKSFQTQLIKLYYEDTLIKRAMGHRICLSCRKKKRREEKERRREK